MNGGRRGTSRSRLASLFAACSLAFVVLWAAPLSAAEPLRIWHAYTGAEADALDNAAREFGKRRGVQTETLAVAFGAYVSKLQAAIPTGHGPDVFIDAHERLPRFVASDLVLAFPDDDALLEDFDPVVAGALAADGRQFGLPLASKCAALYVNRDIIQEEITSFEQLIGHASELPEGVFPLVMEAENPYYVSAFLHAYDVPMLTPEGSFGWNRPEAEQPLGAIVSWVRSGAVPEEATGELTKALFSSGRAAAAISGPWLAPDLPEAMRVEIVALPPMDESGDHAVVPFSTIEGAFVAQGTSQPELARAFATYLAGPEGAALRARQADQVVASRSAWDEPALRQRTDLETFRKAAANAMPMPSHPNMAATWEPAQRALKKILRSDAPVADALAQADRRFGTATRPDPEPRDPTPALLLAGVLLLGVAAYAGYRLSKRSVRVQLARSVPAYRWVAHAALAVGLLVIAPLLVGALTSLFAGRGRDLYYVGVHNYVDIITAQGGDLLSSGSFWLVLLVTVLWTALNLALHLTLGVLLGLALHQKGLRLRGMYRVLLILPWAVPNYVTALAWKGMFHRQMGAINAILGELGVEPVSWFGNFATAFAANLSTNVWLGFPFMMVVTIGALSSIPDALYEAASVDGASRWQKFWLITYPMLKQSLAPAVIMGAVWTFNMFNVVFLVSAGEPDGTTEILVSEAYRWAFTRSQQYGYAAAYAVLIFGVLVILSKGLNRALGDKTSEAAA